MPISRFTRRSFSLIALAGYLLAATVAGIWHDHGDSPCLASGRCTVHVAHTHPHAGRDAHHAHSHAGHRHRHAQSDERDGNTPGEHRTPLHDDDCAACRFLAQHSIVAPLVVIEPSEAAAPLVSDASPAHVCAVVADAHPARGPPA